MFEGAGDGADAIPLIVSGLESCRDAGFRATPSAWACSVLVEVHDGEEPDPVDAMGASNPRPEVSL